MTKIDVTLRFDRDGKLDLSDWNTARLEIVALAALHELAARDNGLTDWAKILRKTLKVARA